MAEKFQERSENLVIPLKHAKVAAFGMTRRKGVAPAQDTCLKALLDSGADPNVRLNTHLWYWEYGLTKMGVDLTGATPFWRAAYGTDVPAMRLLLRYGADPSIPTRKPAGRVRGDDAPAEDDGEVADPSGLPPIPAGGPGVYPIHAASGVGYGEGYAANSHMHAPDGWLPSVKFLIEELGVDVNSRDHNGYTPLHHAAARGDNEMIMYLMSKGADITAVSRRGQTVADMANGPVQRVQPVPVAGPPRLLHRLAPFHLLHEKFHGHGRVALDLRIVPRQLQQVVGALQGALQGLVGLVHPRRHLHRRPALGVARPGEAVRVDPRLDLAVGLLQLLRLERVGRREAEKLERALQAVRR